MSRRLPEQDRRTDEGLMLAYRDGDAAAFEELYRRWRTRLYRFMAYQCGQSGMADELFQEVWMRVINARANYEVSAKFSTWLFRIARNRLVDHWRQTNRQPLVENALFEDCEEGEWQVEHLAAPAEQRPEQTAERRELAAHLVRAVEALPDAQRETFLMAEEGGMTLEAIAATMDVGRETVKSRLRYALAKLRSELEKWR